MTSKQKSSCIMFIAYLMYMPLIFVMQFLLYQHVKATPLMWVLFWGNLPIGILIHLVAYLVKIFIEDTE